MACVAKNRLYIGSVLAVKWEEEKNERRLSTSAFLSLHAKAFSRLPPKCRQLEDNSN